MEDRANQRHVGEISYSEQPSAQPIVDIVIVVRDVIGERRNLRLNAGESVESQRLEAVVFGDGRGYRPLDTGAVQRPVVFDDAFERFPGEIEPIELSITPLESRQDT